MADTYDGIQIGALATENYLEEQGIMRNSRSINALYICKYRSDLSYNDTGVLNTDQDDANSNVYELVKPPVFETDTNNDLEIVIKNPTDANGNLEVALQDQTTRPIDVRLSRVITGPYTVASATTPNEYTITLNDATGLQVNDKIGIFQNSTNPGTYFGYIKSITDDTLTLNIPFDISFGTSAVLYELDNNLNKDGSSTPLTYQVANESDVPIDINRLLFKMITTTAVELNDFGDIATLTNGLVIRKNNGDGTYINLMTIRNNSELSLYAYDYQGYDAANPGQGVYGLAARFTFNGQDKHGVVVRISKGESLEALVQDDLTDILDFKIMAEGSYTDEY